MSNAEQAGYEAMQVRNRAHRIAWLGTRYGMPPKGAAKLLEDLAAPDGAKNFLARLGALPAALAFDPIDAQAEGRTRQSTSKRQRVLEVLPEAVERARADAQRHGHSEPTAKAINAWAAALAGCSVRLVIDVRAKARVQD